MSLKNSTRSRKLLKFLFRIVILVGVAVAILTSVLIYFQRSLVFLPPKRWSDLTPAAFHTPFSEETILTPDGFKLRAWWVKDSSSSSTTRPLILYHHGNGGDLSRLAHVAALFHRYGWDALLFDYRGYGRSSGSPSDLSETALWRDSEAAYRFLSSKTAQPITAWGHSLGAGVAAHLATQVPLHGLVIEGAFNSIFEMAQFRYPYLPLVPAFIWDPFTTGEYLKNRLPVPLLMIHCLEDSIIPFSQGERAFKMASEPKRQMVLAQCTHNDFPEIESRYREELLGTVNSWYR